MNIDEKMTGTSGVKGTCLKSNSLTHVTSDLQS